jgi:threonine dehydrogenase-like Zn-dependent dehydrogenase
VLVIGAGPIGLSAIEFSRLSGAKTIVMDVNEARLDLFVSACGSPTPS